MTIGNVEWKPGKGRQMTTQSDLHVGVAHTSHYYLHIREYTMDPNLLRTKFSVDIVQKLDIPAIVPCLAEAGLLTRHDQEELMNKYLSEEIRILKFIDKLVKKGSVGFLKFIDCLKRCREAGGHEELIKIMGVSALGKQAAMNTTSLSTGISQCSFGVQHQNKIIANLPSCSTQFPMVTSDNIEPEAVSHGHVSEHTQLANLTKLRTKYLTKLTEHLDVVAIAPHLVVAGLLPRHEEQHLLNEYIPSRERIIKLSENLGRGGQESVPKFLDCLRKTADTPGHSELLQIMQSGIQQEDTRSPVAESGMIMMHTLSSDSYRELIAYIDSMVQWVSSDQLLAIAALFLPDDHLKCLRSVCGSSLTFQSLVDQLAQIGICNPIEVDPLIVILTELNQSSLNESVLKYAYDIQNAAINLFQISSDKVPSDGFFYLRISHQICPLTACGIWDLKQNMSLMLMDHSSYRGQFWFQGISMDSKTVTIVWQFLSTHEQEILRKLDKLHETVNMIQHQNSSGCVSALFESRTLIHIESHHLGKRSRADHDPVGVPSLSSSCDDFMIKRKRAETSSYLDIYSKHNVIGKSFNPNIISEDISQKDGKELIIGDGDLTHEEWKILIDSNAHDCERLIDITSLLPFLLQNHLLTSNEQEILMKSTSTECQKIQHLLLLIQKKGAEGYRGFLRAIEHESSHLGHRELYTILTNCKPSILPPKELLIQKLKDQYTHPDWTLKSVSGPKPQKEFFVQLALVKKAKLNADDKLTDKFLHQTLHGSVDDICNKKVLIDINTLFRRKKGKKIEIEKILVEGAPGIGKTRLACYLCSKWAEGELLQHYELVILVPLRRFQRGKHSTEKLDIQDVIELYFKSKKADIACEELSNNGSRNTLVILEGWDELDPVLRKENSFFHDIVAGSAPQFSNASVIVTSRCTVSDTLYEYMDKRIEVLGFDSEHIDKYIASHVPDKKEMIVSHLQKYPNIRALAHIPLTLSIFCNIVQENDYIPLTLTELYDLYILNSLLFSLKKVDPSLRLPGLSSLSDLPTDASQVVKALSNLALNGFRKGRFVFRRKHLQKVGLPIDSDRAFDGYGLLNSITCHIKVGYDHFYQFVHLTVQEYLAAYSLLNLDQNCRLEILDELRLEKKFQVVCRFYSGLTKLSDCAAKKAIIRNTRKNNNEDVLLLLHCLYEVQDPRICREAALHLDRKLKLDNKSLNATDCLCLAYTLINAGGSWELSMRLCNIGSHGLDAFYSYLLFHQESLRNSVSFSKLDLAHNSLHLKKFTGSSPSGVELSSIIKGPFTIEHFVLDSNELGDEQIGVLARAMCSNKTISALSVARCDISAVGAKYLAEMLCSNNTLKSLLWNRIGDDGVVHLADALKQNSTLLELMIGDNNIKERGFELLCEMLNVNTGLKELRIEHIQIGECECHKITRFLENNRHLELLDVTKSGIGDEGVAIIANGIMKHPDCALRRFCFFACDISDNGVKVLSELMEKGLLVSLQLGCNPKITEKSVPRFVRALEKTKTFKRLRLEGCGIASEDSKQQLLAFNRRGIDITFTDNIHLDRALRGVPMDQIESISIDGSRSSL